LTTDLTLLIRWLQHISLALIVGVIFALRLIVMPALAVLQPEAAVKAMGKAMSRTRRWLRLLLFVLIVTEVWSIVASPVGTIRLALIIVLSAVIYLLTISPHRQLALRLHPHRRWLLDLGLIVGVWAIFYYR
jgi:uncharacterized membrane protein